MDKDAAAPVQLLDMFCSYKKYNVHFYARVYTVSLLIL